MAFADTFIQQFDRMVRRDGGSLRLLSVDGNRICAGYAPGHDPDCEDGACIMPHVELQEMMAETLARREPDMAIEVILVSPEE